MRDLILRANPLALLAWGLLAVVGSFLIHTAGSALVVLAVYAALAVLFVPVWRPLWWRLLAVAIGAVSLWWSSWLLGGHDVGLATFAAGRVLVLALPGAILAAFIEPTRLGDALGQNLRLPARFVTAFTAVLSRFDGLGQIWEQLAATRRSRGFGPTRNPISRARTVASMTFGLLVAAMRGATQLSLAMDARGFARAQHRSWSQQSRWSTRDTVISLTGLLVTVVLPLALRLR